MAVRFRINPYSGVTPIAQAFGNLAQAFISGPSQFEIDKMAAEGRYADVRTQDVQRGISADAEARRLIEGGGPFDPRKTGAILLGGGRKGDDIGHIARTFTYLDPTSTVEQRDRSYGAAGGPYSGTETGFKVEDTTKRRGQDVAAGATLGAARIAQQGAMDRTTVAVLGSDGKPRYVTAAEARAAGVMPVLEDSKISVSPDGKGGFTYEPNRPGLPAPIPSSEKDRYVLTPGADGGATYQPVRPGMPAYQKPQSTVGQLINERNQLPPDHPDRPKFDDAIAKSITANVKERDQKIAALVAQGLDVNEATAVTDGVKDMKIDQSSGKVYLIDKRDPTNVKEVRIQPAGVAPTTISPTPAPGDIQRRAADTTGFLPGAASALSGTIGQVLPSLASPEIERNRQRVGTINELAIDVLLKGRSQAEQDRIRTMVLPSVGPFTSATQLSERMVEMRELTIQRIREAETILSQPRSRAHHDEAYARIDKAKALLAAIDRYTAGVAPPPAGQQGGTDPLSQARDAIARGAPRDAVIQRLRGMGVDPSGL